MSLSAGSRLGQYEVVSTLGAGVENMVDSIHDELRKPSTAAEKTNKIAASLRAKSRRRSVRKTT